VCTQGYAYQTNSYLLQTFRYRAHAWLENGLASFDYRLLGLVCCFFIILELRTKKKGLEKEVGLHCSLKL
jgi:hypothetical protein